tara:strand:- start:1574 stop:1873 length:300 start_codon:yes stop_codon:yes gene_type:complete
MSRKLGVSTAFISNVEHGRKEPPSGFDSKILEAYSLTEESAEDLLKEYALARNEFSISTSTGIQQETVAMFARQLPKISDTKLQELKTLFLNEYKGCEK